VGSVYGNEFLDRPGPGRVIRSAGTRTGTAVVVGVVLVCATLLAGLAWVPWRTPSDRTAPVDGSGTAVAASVTAPSAARGTGPEDGTTAAVIPLTDDLPAPGTVAVLPRGAGTLAGFRVGHPRTTSGAVAAAVEYASHAGCLTTVCVDATLKAGIDVSWQGAREHLLAGMADNRRVLGIPEHSPVPAGAVMTATPMAFQIVPTSGTTEPAPNRLASDGPAGLDAQPRIRVLLLCYVAMAGPAISPRNAVVALPVTLRWDGQDFKQVPGDRSYPELVTRPGTPQAAQLGWREFAA
jgi:hypothetical protein